MPVYEFQCAKCAKRFEVVSSFSARQDNAVCPECGAREVTQVFGGFKVGIARTRLNPGVFERKKGKAPEYKPPAGG